MTFNEGYFKVLNFIHSANIMLAKQFDLFCQNIDLTELQKENIIKTLMRNKELFTDEKNYFYSSSPDIPYNKFSQANEKAVWFVSHFCKEFEYFNFNPKPPANAFICTSDTDVFNELTIFYIPCGNEATQSRLIETVYGGMPSVVPTALILSDESSLENITLSDNFDIKIIVVIDAEGNVKRLF